MLEARIAALAADRERGGSALAVEAVAILAASAEQAPEEGFLEAVGGVARGLLRTRPGMVAVENRVHKVMANLLAAEVPPSQLRPVALGLCEAARWQAEEERASAAREAAKALRGERVLTVGASDTVIEALAAAHRVRPRTVVVAQGAPLRDGQRAAQRLALAGLAVELVPDAALGHAALDCDEAIVGAEAVLAGGALVNRAGTSLAALAMGIGGRALWVACDETKVTWRDALPLEEGDPGQVWTPSPLLPVKVRHPWVDVTPPELVRGYCTERGVLRAQDLAPVAEGHRRRAAWTEEPGTG